MVKKLFFVAVATLFANGSFAQFKTQKHSPVMQMNAKMEKSNVISNANDEKVAADYSISNRVRPTTYEENVYYERPSGQLYVGWNSVGRGFGPTMYLACPFTDIPFKYHYTKGGRFTKLTWSIEYPSSGKSFDIFEYGLGEINTEDSIMTFYGFQTGVSYAMPTMAYGAKTFLPGTDGYYYIQDPDKYYPYLTTRYDTIPVTNYHDHAQSGSAAGANVNIIGWSGFNNRHYLFGSGTIDEDSIPTPGDTVKFTAYIDYCYQNMGTTSGPLYIEDAFNDILSFSENPIPEGKVVTLRIFNPETGKNYGIMTCGPENIVEYIGSSWPYETDYGTYHMFDAQWAHWVEDDFGNLTTEPIIVNGPWAIQVKGLDQEGVDVGFRGVQNAPEDEMDPCFIHCYDKNSTYARSYRYTSKLAMFFTFNAMYDNVHVMENGYFIQNSDTILVEDLNYVKVSDDGTTCTIGTTKLPGARVYTTAPVYGYYTAPESESEEAEDILYLMGPEEADATYYFEQSELPEWVKSYDINYTTWLSGTTSEDQDIEGYNYVTFTCDPLPAGTKSRSVKLYMKGTRGAVSDLPIIVYQGEKPSEGLKGDANNDGTVDVTDITTIASYILGTTPETWNADNADANSDSTIDVTDITTTAGIILGN